MRDVHHVVNPIQVQLDALAAVSGIILGHVFFVVFIAGQGVRQLRLQTEMNLAREIHLQIRSHSRVEPLTGP